MSADRQMLDRLRARAWQARAEGQFAQAARLEHRVVAMAEALGLAGARTRALLWEGYSLRQAGEDDLALAALLQAANERAATADPADVFSALIAIIHISLNRKPAAFCRLLLEQGRRYLADVQQPWTALLDYLEGELAYRRGDFAAARDWHCRASVGRRDEYPKLTVATHLWALCRVAFRRRDWAELERWTGLLSALSPGQALERQLIRRAQLLWWRAQQATLPCPDSMPAPVATARALLAEHASVENRDSGARGEAWRVLALAGCWEEVDLALSRHSPPTDSFDAALLLGDLALNRMRTTLGVSVMDDEYGEDAARPLSLPASARLWLEAAVAYYQSALPLAKAEDARLETEWHSATIRGRLART